MLDALEIAQILADDTQFAGVEMAISGFVECLFGLSWPRKRYPTPLGAVS
jgi:hypothetical protein